VFFDVRNDTGEGGEVIFTVCDENGDGRLSLKSFSVEQFGRICTRQDERCGWCVPLERCHIYLFVTLHRYSILFMETVCLVRKSGVSMECVNRLRLATMGVS
jgi:hypothetical protein